MHQGYSENTVLTHITSSLFFFLVMSIIPVDFVFKIICNVMVLCDSLFWEYFQNFQRLFRQQLGLEIKKIFRIMQI